MKTKKEMTDCIQSYLQWSKDRKNPDLQESLHKAYRKARRLEHLAENAGCQVLASVFSEIYEQCEYFARYKEQPSFKDEYLTKMLPAAMEELAAATFKDYSPTPFLPTPQWPPKP